MIYEGDHSKTVNFRVRRPSRGMGQGLTEFQPGQKEFYERRDEP